MSAKLSNGFEKLFEMLDTTYTGSNPYPHVAILDTVEPETFVKGLAGGAYCAIAHTIYADIVHGSS